MIGIKTQQNTRDKTATSISHTQCVSLYDVEAAAQREAATETAAAATQLQKIKFKEIFCKQIARAHRPNCNGIKGLGRGNSANCVRRHRNYNMPSKFFSRFDLSLKIKKRLINPLFDLICIKSL